MTTAAAPEGTPSRRVEGRAPVVPFDRQRQQLHDIVAAGETVFATLGAGLSPVIYARALALELHARGVPFRRETTVEVRFRGSSLGREPVDFLFEQGALLLVVEPWVSRLAESRARSIAAADACRWAMVVNFGGAAFEARILEGLDRPNRRPPRPRLSVEAEDPGEEPQSAEDAASPTANGS